MSIFLQAYLLADKSFSYRWNQVLGHDIQKTPKEVEKLHLFCIFLVFSRLRIFFAKSLIAQWHCPLLLMSIIKVQIHPHSCIYHVCVLLDKHKILICLEMEKVHFQVQICVCVCVCYMTNTRFSFPLKRRESISWFRYSFHESNGLQAIMHVI